MCSQIRRLFTVCNAFIVVLIFCHSGFAQGEKINDPTTWSEEAWADRLSSTDDYQAALQLGRQLQLLSRGKDLQLLTENWTTIPVQAKQAVLRSYFPGFNKQNKIDDEYFQVMDLGCMDEDADVNKTAKSYVDALALRPITMDPRSYSRWKKSWKDKTSAKILADRCKFVIGEMKSYSRFEVRDGLLGLTSAMSSLLTFHEFRKICQQAGLAEVIEKWKQKGWTDVDQANTDRIVMALNAKSVDLPADFKKWTDAQWKQALTMPNDLQWRAGWTLGKQIQQMPANKDFQLLNQHWTVISPQVRCQILKTYQPGFFGLFSIDDDYFDVLMLGYEDEHEKVKRFATTYLNAITFSKLADDPEKLRRWIEAQGDKKAAQIVIENGVRLVKSMPTLDEKAAKTLVENMSKGLGQFVEKQVPEMMKAGLKTNLDDWLARGWIEDGDYRRIARSTWDRAAALIRIKSESFQVGDEKKMKYYLIGRHEGQKVPKGGFKLCLILPGGDGSKDFNGFCQTIHREQAPPGYLTVQLVAPVWTDDVKVVWPTEKSNPAGARFTTEEFIKKVIEDVEKRGVKINRQFVLALGWSSGGPPIYKASLDLDSPITGVMPTMSIFSNLDLPDLTRARGKPYYVLHSPDERLISFDRHAKVAAEKLKQAGAKVTLDTYAGGHGWRGKSVSKIGTGLRWLDQQLGEKQNKPKPDDR